MIPIKTRVSPLNAMPTSADPGARLFRGGGSVALTMGSVEDVNVIGGRVFVKVLDYDHAVAYPNCPLMCFGGDNDRFAFFAVTKSPHTDEDTELREVLLVHRDVWDTPYAIGMKQPRKFELVADHAEDPGNEDHALQITPSDHALRNAGARVVVDSNGAITLATGLAKYIRAQLAEEGGAFRVSRTGSATTERILLAVSFLNWLNTTMRNHLVAQNSRITALESAMSAVYAKLSTVLPVAGGDGGVVTFGLGSFSGAGSQTVPTAGEEHKSDMFQLSADNLGGG